MNPTDRQERAFDLMNAAGANDNARPIALASLEAGDRLTAARTALIECAAREGLEETHLPVDVDNLVFVDVYDAPDRDPRGRVVGTAWHTHLTGEDALVEPVADDDAAAAKWLSIKALLAGELGDIAFDHADVLRDTLAMYPTPAA